MQSSSKSSLTGLTKESPLEQILLENYNLKCKKIDELTTQNIELTKQMEVLLEELKQKNLEILEIKQHDKPNLINQYGLLDWIDESKLNYRELCSNTSASLILRKNMDKINWYYLCQNPSAIHLIEKELHKNSNSEKIKWVLLCLNPTAICLIEAELEKNPDSEKIDWQNLCLNPAAIHLLEEELLKNTDPKK